MSDIDKTSAPETEAVTETPEVPEAPNSDDLVKSAVAEVTDAYEKRIEALEAKLTKVLETPLPGGPAMTAPAHMRGTMQKAEKLAEAARYTALAEQINDPDLKRFYKEAAASARAAA